jgi:hypothetical protein
VIAIIAILIGLLLPAVQKVREAAARIQVQSLLSHTLCNAMHIIFEQDGEFPTSLLDPRFREFIDPQFDSPVDQAQSYGFQLSLTTHVGTPFRLETWDFRLVAENYSHRYVMNKTCEIQSQSPSDPVPPFDPEILAAGAEMLTPYLEENQGIGPLARAFLADPATLPMIFGILNPDGSEGISVREIMQQPLFAPLADVMRFGENGENIDELPHITMQDLEGSPGFLLSFDALQILARHFSSNENTTKALDYRLILAEVFHNRGQTAQRNNQLQVFIRLVNSFEGRSLTAREARILRALARSF